MTSIKSNRLTEVVGQKLVTTRGRNDKKTIAPEDGSEGRHQEPKGYDRKTEKKAMFAILPRSSFQLWDTVMHCRCLAW